MKITDDLKLDCGLPPQDLRAEDMQSQARRLADSVGSAIIDNALPVELLGAVADCLKGDLEEIKAAAVDIMEEQQAIEDIRQQSAGKEG